jgi:pyruvate/2-oxoglutarate dehydrogenase complex dihydrolipoamide dehydrogenase (E3) component
VQVDFDFTEVMERVQRVITTIEPHDSVERYTGLGVECIHGEARIDSPYQVTVNGRTLTTRAIVIAAGGQPLVPPISGLAEVGFLTSDTVWELRELPERLLVLGGGPIGCELSQAFARFGSQVTVVDRLPRILPREDAEIAERMSGHLASDGVRFMLGYEAVEFRSESGGKVLIARRGDETVEIPFDRVLVAVGRVATTRGYGLEELGIALAPNGTIEVNEYLQTRYPNIYAVGDVTGPYQFTHVAAHQAWFAAVNALFGGLKKFKVDYSVIPWATFTDPEVARVGLNEQEAQAKGIAYEVSTFDVAELDRAITEEAAHGVVKVLTVPGKDRILGVTIVAAHAGELIAEYVAAMRHNFGLNKILGTIHVYPTLAEANKYAAGAWKRAHAPAAALRWLEWFHRWRRG